MEIALEEFLTYMNEVKKSSNNTILSYKNDLSKLLTHLSSLGIYETEKINETCLNSYILLMEREGKSPATVSRNIAAMKAFILFLIKKGKIQADPTERMKSPKVEKKPPVILTIEQVDSLLSKPNTSTFKGIRDKAMLELLYATGIRVSELLSLTMKDINIKNKFLVCRTDKKERMIPFGNVAKVSFENYIKSQKELKDIALSDYCFTNIHGEQMTRQGFWKIIKAYGKAADIDIELTPQILRNSFAVHLMENGADIYSVQELLGHSDVSTTQSYIKGRKRKLLEVYTSAHPRI